jgi:hypothetical protein
VRGVRGVRWMLGVLGVLLTAAVLCASETVKTDVPPVPPGVDLPAPQVDVHVEGVLDLTGHIRYARALDGPPELRAAAVKALASWEYKPAKMFDAPIPAVMQGVVTFKR